MSKKSPDSKHASVQRRSVIIGVAVLVVAAIAGAIVLVTANKSAQPVTQKPTLESTSKKVAELESGKDFSGQVKAYQDYLKDHPNDATAQQKLGAVATNAKQYDVAIAAYQKAADLDPKKKLAELHGIATVYIIQGDNAKAIDYLKQAIVEMKKNGDQTMVLQISSDEAAIRGLGGTP